jgi:hypothetical protein
MYGVDRNEDRVARLEPVAGDLGCKRRARHDRDSGIEAQRFLDDPLGDNEALQVCGRNRLAPTYLVNFFADALLANGCVRAHIERPGQRDKRALRRRDRRVDSRQACGRPP